MLKPGGFFAYQTSSGDSYLIGIALEEACRRALGPERAEKTFRVPGTVTDSERENRALMEAAGFKDIKIESHTEYSVLEIADVERMWKVGCFETRFCVESTCLGTRILKKYERRSCNALRNVGMQKEFCGIKLQVGLCRDGRESDKCSEN